MTALILAWGSDLHGDDGVGPIVARQAAASLAGTDLSIAQQILPEHADDLAAHDLVVLVDAAADGRPGEVRCRRIDATDGGRGGWEHGLSPEALVGLTRSLGSRVPETWLVTITGETFALGGTVSETVAAAVPAAVARVVELVADASGHRATTAE